MSWSPKVQTGSETRRLIYAWEGCCLKLGDAEQCSAKTPWAPLCWQQGDSWGKRHSVFVLLLLSIPWWPLGGTGNGEGGSDPECPFFRSYYTPVQIWWLPQCRGSQLGVLTEGLITVVDSGELEFLTTKEKVDLYSLQRTKSTISLLKNWDTYLSTVF